MIIGYIIIINDLIIRNIDDNWAEKALSDFLFDAYILAKILCLI